METLLKSKLTAHYNLPTSTITNIAIQTSATYFEVEDDQYKETQIHFAPGSGMASYSNSSAFDITIINYDKFLTSLLHAFQHGKERCDLIVYTNTNFRSFLLNELKDRKPKQKVENKAASQLSASLNCIMQVPDIVAFINKYSIKRCCYFNKQPVSPAIITATSAFNRISLIAPDGLRMSNPVIESHGFEFYQYIGNQVFRIV